MAAARFLWNGALAIVRNKKERNLSNYYKLFRFCASISRLGMPQWSYLRKLSGTFAQLKRFIIK